MKTLHNHIIIYDDACPMCNLYTRSFIKAKMLEQGGRKSFSHMAEHHPDLFDTNRACNEIALIDTRSGAVIYGVDSLIKIIANNYPWIGRLASSPPMQWFLKRLYGFISYNRKVIAPAEQKHVNCQPAFHLGYRVFYLIICWLLTALVLRSYAALLTNYLPVGSLSREFIICGGQLIVQGILVSINNKHNVMDYLGNLMTISLGGAILLMPGMIIFKALATESWLPVFYFGLIVIIIFSNTLYFFSKV